MHFNSDALLALIGTIAPNRYAQAVLIIVLFYTLARIVDLIISR